MTSSDVPATWNPAAVIEQAKELIHSSNYEKVGDARKSVDDAIAQWVQSVQQHPHGAAVVIELWRQYAALEIELRQFKQATKVFESAVSCPVARTSTELWLQYASFCAERKKFSNARKIFVRGLQSVKLNTGRMDPVSPSSSTGLQEGSKKRGIVSPDVTDIKRVKQEGCPHLLFDMVSQGETHQELGEELLERLSDVLSDSAVFQGVKDLCDNQRQRDRETLYRWQDLVGMQMKEGSELFARHVDVEMKHASDPRVLITLKTQHLEQRREFITRCQMSQQQFIEISAMDRMNALKAQQISLENMKIPEMTVSTDPNVIGMQRAILGLILEAEKLWREESSKSATTPVKAVASGSSASEDISEAIAAEHVGDEVAMRWIVTPTHVRVLHTGATARRRDETTIRTNMGGLLQVCRIRILTLMVLDTSNNSCTSSSNTQCEDRSKGSNHRTMCPSNSTSNTSHHTSSSNSTILTINSSLLHTSSSTWRHLRSSSNNNNEVDEEEEAMGTNIRQ
uniref:Suppressor of forked domain-containing protein n=1 Tax=Globisporangium ultimum (strain ATCC 200006 / CBS 805.95 / DAOM BR144) TaxID=431595 RepID=K3W972_GLOUD